MSANVKCAVVSCDRVACSKGYCDAHYRRVRKYGDPRADVALGDLQKKERPIRTCEVCGDQFRQRKHQNGRYCTRACASSIPASIERLTRGARETATRRADAMRGRGEGRTYRKRNGRHEHRLVAEQQLGRPLLPGEVVHHRDGNKLNNAPENLQVMTQAEHMRVHGLGIPGIAPAHRPWEKRRKKVTV